MEILIRRIANHQSILDDIVDFLWNWSDETKVLIFYVWLVVVIGYHSLIHACTPSRNQYTRRGRENNPIAQALIKFYPYIMPPATAFGYIIYYKLFTESNPKIDSGYVGLGIVYLVIVTPIYLYIAIKRCGAKEEQERTTQQARRIPDNQPNRQVPDNQPNRRDNNTLIVIVRRVSPTEQLLEAYTKALEGANMDHFISNHPTLIENHSLLDLEAKLVQEFFTKPFFLATRAGSDCQICMVAFQENDQVTSIGCIHTMHFDCLINWCKVKPTCPLCRFKYRDKIMRTVERVGRLSRVLGR